MPPHKTFFIFACNNKSKKPPQSFLPCGGLDDTHFKIASSFDTSLHASLDPIAVNKSEA